MLISTGEKMVLGAIVARTFKIIVSVNPVPKVMNRLSVYNAKMEEKSAYRPEMAPGRRT
jgi:hypothetical protein